jgi:HAD superfamily hydrolase (TIGR01509 family)
MPVPPFLVLDLDDTILDYTASAESIWPRLYAEYAPKLGVPVEALRQAADESRRWYWSDMDRFREGRLNLQRARRVIIRDAFSKLSLTDLEAADSLADSFSRDRETAVRPFPGALEALAGFRRSGARMVLLTNGESALQRAKIERFSLAEFFTGIQIEGEAGFGKPDPRAHRAALAALGAEPALAWMIGDDLEFDIRPAKALGMRTAWIRSKPADRATVTPDVAAPSLRDLAGRWGVG